MSDLGKGKLKKLSSRDQTMAGLLRLAPLLSFILMALPAPLLFLLLFLLSATTESAALYLFLSLLTGALGFAAAVVTTILLLIYKRKWLSGLRNKLAANGITAGEVEWFEPELTTSERQALEEITKENALLGDAYRETLAARLMATRIKQRAERELVRVRRRINQARNLKGADTKSLAAQLQSDRQRLEQVSHEATERLAKAKAQLQMIEASASRESNKMEMELMMGQLSFTQEYLPLLLEMTKLESGFVGENEAENPRNPREPLPPGNVSS